MRAFPSLLSLSLSLAAATAAGCVDPGADDLGDDLADAEALDADAPALSQQTSALCWIGTTPPAADWTHNFATDPNQIRLITDYGTDACADYVVRLTNGGTPGYEQGTISIYLTGAVPTSPEACVGTSLTVRKWTPPTTTSGWTSSATTTYGEWTATGCDFPRTYTATSYWTSGIRFEISTKRSYCPGGGPLCVLQHGLPFKVKVTEG
jgi:hypothetical protein